jgi:ubiquinone/menaquinone biosynthesis C-methylase UbiE
MTAEDLKGVDEFHTGGIQATDHLIGQLIISCATRVLDIGCGIGGTTRHIAMNTGASVTGFDLTPAYVETANALSEAVGISDLTHFKCGSALSMPVENSSFDVATMLHVGMNVSDKATLFQEAARALTSTGTFALFDIMRTGDGELAFPFPWAEKADWSFVESPEVYKSAASQAGFELIRERNRREFTLEFFSNAFAAMEKNGAPPPVGIHLLMKDTAGQKIQNYVAEVKAGRLAPFEMIFQKS